VRRDPDRIEPLTADLRRLHFTVSRRFVEKRDAARDAMSHARAGGSTEEVLEAALDLLLQRHGKRKGLVEKPRAKRRSARPPQAEHISAHVRREVWDRDGGCCQWPVADGEVCGSTTRVEYDHVIPRAKGGPSTVENLRLLCRAHNQLAASRVYGDDWMSRYSRKRGARRPDRVGEPEGRYRARGRERQRQPERERRDRRAVRDREGELERSARTSPD
jgi:5-methylcytosine-specific restriction endonuclease McrA